MKKLVTSTTFFFFFLILISQVIAADINFTRNETGNVTTFDRPPTCCSAFLHLTTFIILFAIAIFFLLLMHNYSDNFGASITFGVLSGTFFLILVAMIASGYQIFQSATIFFIRTDYYLSIVLLALALYAFIMANLGYKKGKEKKAEEENPDRPQ